MAVDHGGALIEQGCTGEGLFSYYYAFYGNAFVDPATSPVPTLYYYPYPNEVSKWDRIAERQPILNRNRWN